MKQYIDILKKHLAEHVPNYGYHDAHCLLDMLCNCYTENNPVENAHIRQAFENLDFRLKPLSLQENDAVIDIVCDLCIEYQHLSFVAGIEVGLRLFSELERG